MRLKEALRRPRLRRAATQAGLCLCLLGLCAAYTLGLGDNATAVVAGKRELPSTASSGMTRCWPSVLTPRGERTKPFPFWTFWMSTASKPTFFLVGGWVDKYPDMVKEIFARGHEIGNHSDTHPHMSQLSESAIKDELRIMSDKVEKLTGVRPTLFRPPYGDYNNRVVEVSRAEGYECVQWSIDSLDWKDRGTEDIIKQCTYRVDNGDIVLFHNDSNDIVNALPTVIKHYQGLGYTILPVSELLLDGEYTIDVQGKQHPKET